MRKATALTMATLTSLSLSRQAVPREKIQETEQYMRWITDLLT